MYIPITDILCRRAHVTETVNFNPNQNTLAVKKLQSRTKKAMLKRCEIKKMGGQGQCSDSSAEEIRF